LDQQNRRMEDLRKLLNTSEDPILLLDSSGIVIDANFAATSLLQVDSASITGKSIHVMGNDGKGAIEVARTEEVATTGQSTHFETQVDGKYYEVRLYPLKGESGNVEEIAAYLHDVAPRHNMEQALRQAEEMYRNIYENATEGIFQITLEGRFLSANPALAHIHGYDSPEEMIVSVTDLSTQMYVDVQRRHDLISLLGRYGRAQNFEARMFRKDRSIQWISINARLVRDSNGNPLYHEGTMRDITQRKENEAAIKESEERYRTVVEHSNDGMAILQGSKHIYVNQRFVEMFEYNTPDEVIGTPVGLLVHPDDQDLVESMRHQRDKGEPVPVRYEFKGVTSKGNLIYIEASGTTMTYRGKRVSLVYLRDITERKRSEETLIESRNELERLNRAKSKAVNHISHELKTPLALSRASVRILRRKLSTMADTEDLAKMLDMLERNLDRLLEVSNETDEIFRASQYLEAAGLRSDIERLEQRMENIFEVSEDMRAHTRAIRQWIDRHMPSSHGRFKVIDLAPFVQSSVEKAKYLSRGRRVQIIVDGPPERLRISMNPEILREVIESLLKNAIENTPEGGKITVRYARRDNTAWIDVVDTGVGITEDNKAYVFDGLFHATETDMYSSKRAYDFGAGGKGLDLLKLKVYAKRFGFEINLASTRCPFIPTDRDVCPGDVTACHFISSGDECEKLGGTTFSVGFRASSDTALRKREDRNKGQSES
jgi:PAS domain S-box-containing protein